MLEDRTPLGIAVAGVFLIIIGMVVKSLLPRLAEVGGFVIAVGWFAIVVGILWFIYTLLTGRPRA